VSTITAWPFAVLAQTAKVYRIGILSTDGPADAKSIFDAMLRALASHGYMPDRNMALAIRASGIHTEQLPQLAKDLVASNET
jgi:putative tryptophan/tyrosine transport system substrate-binding protein